MPMFRTPSYFSKSRSSGAASITGSPSHRNESGSSSTGEFVSFTDLRDAIANYCEESLPKTLAVERQHLLAELRELLQANAFGGTLRANSLISVKSKSKDKATLRSPPLPEERCKLVQPPRNDPNIGHFLRPILDDSRELPMHATLIQDYQRLIATSGNNGNAVPRSWLPSCAALDAFSRGHFFERAVGLTVLLNAFMLGLETHFMCVSYSLTPPSWLGSCEKLFCVIFTLEILFRLTVQRCLFFFYDGFWNTFDLFIVILQVSEQVCQMLVRSGNGGLLLRYALELLRPIRIVRLVRVVRNFESLRSIAAAIAGSMKDLCLTIVILCLVIFACSVMFTQVVMAALVEGTENDEKLRLWFGDLFRTHLTLAESILGGLSWDEAIRPLVSEVSPLVAVIFCLYIAFSIFAVSNMVTGVFVEKATQMANEDTTLRLARRISDLFQSDVADGENVTWEQFEEKLGEADMQEYFKELNVDPSEARILFKLLDSDESGSVDAAEIVDGLMRLHGNARALDLKVLHYEMWRVRGEVQAQQRMLDLAMESLESNIVTLIDRVRTRRRHTDTTVVDDSPSDDHSNVASYPSITSSYWESPFSDRGSQETRRSDIKPIRLKGKRAVRKNNLSEVIREFQGSQSAMGGFWSRGDN